MNSALRLIIQTIRRRRSVEANVLISCPLKYFLKEGILAGPQIAFQQHDQIFSGWCQSVLLILRTEPVNRQLSWAINRSQEDQVCVYCLQTIMHHWDCWCDFLTPEQKRHHVWIWPEMTKTACRGSSLVTTVVCADTSQRPNSSSPTSEEPAVSKYDGGESGQECNQEHPGGFLGHLQVVHCDFIPQGQTVNTEHYSDNLRDLMENARHKQPELWYDGKWALQHANTLARSVQVSRVWSSCDSVLLFAKIKSVLWVVAKHGSWWNRKCAYSSGHKKHVTQLLMMIRGVTLN